MSADLEAQVAELVKTARDAALLEAEGIVIARALKMQSYQLGEMKALKNAAAEIRKLVDA